MNDHSGWQIVDRCLEAADDAAWNAFVERFEPALVWGIRRALRSVGCDRNRDELLADLLQECYCKILARESRILRMCRERNDRALAAFFGRVGERCARDFFRARWADKRGSRNRIVAWSDAVEDHAVAESGCSPEERLLISEARSDLLDKCRRAAGDRKRERNFRVLVMAFLEGLSSREIAERFAGRLSRTCIDSVVYRARLRLSKEGAALGNRRAVA